MNRAHTYTPVINQITVNPTVIVISRAGIW